MSDPTTIPPEPANPSAAVAFRTLRALRVDNAETAAGILAGWCRPSPRLSVADVTAVLQAFDDLTGITYSRDMSEPVGGPIPEHVEGRRLGGRNGENQ